MDEKELQDLRHFFDTLAKDYTEHCKVLGINSTLATEIALLASFAPKTVLEYGIGNGRFADVFMSHYPQTNYTGVDISEKMLALVKNKTIILVLSDIETYVEEASRLKKMFDICIAPFTTLHHTKRERQFDLVTKLFTISEALLLNVFRLEADIRIHGEKGSLFTLFNGLEVTTYPIDPQIREVAVEFPLTEDRSYLYLKK